MDEKFYDPNFPVKRRDELLKQLEKISKDKGLPFSFSTSSYSSDPRWSNWLDTFTDHGHWYKTWGNAK
ncbi:hypothetical protein [Peribacillus sp. V2I11]|uniref:hypothetical protein n=1 Tax=Peribacillus sp. V2I11 TaxID=3042277 RepID=UPI00277F767A|nr:hypothetical protein [Peribacillus sp. V2I11]MDQ0884809.1 hypothetical protein [Peribacillus sp. V2I11]